MTDGAHHTKQALRQTIAARLRAIPAAELAEKSLAICDLVQTLPFWKNAKLILSYAALPDEVDVSRVTGKPTAYSKIVGTELQAWLPEPGAAFTPGPLGTAEPSEESATRVEPGKIDVILVPGRLFQKNGHRLGRGKGFYDRYLAQPHLSAIKVGICFSAQLSEEITPDSWDVPMDWIVHEAGVIDCKSVAG